MCWPWVSFQVFFFQKVYVNKIIANIHFLLMFFNIIVLFTTFPRSCRIRRILLQSISFVIQCEFFYIRWAFAGILWCGGKWLQYRRYNWKSMSSQFVFTFIHYVGICLFCCLFTIFTLFDSWFKYLKFSL